MGFLAGKRLLITGVLSNRSIAYGIARACHREGAELAFSYVGERFKDRITEFAGRVRLQAGLRLRRRRRRADRAPVRRARRAWPEFDGFVHAIAFAPREAIAGDFLDGLTRENFRIAHDISAYSFPAMAKAALPGCAPARAADADLPGRVRYVPNYNTMGLAKASLEASVRYLAAEPGRQGRARQRHLGRPDQDAGRLGHQGLRQAAGRCSPPQRRSAATSPSTTSATRRLPAVGPGRGISAEIVYVDGGFSQVGGVDLADRANGRRAGHGVSLPDAHAVDVVPPRPPAPRRRPPRRGRARRCRT
jgi:enoyl-[acyl-carrier protein] reductase I